MTEKAKIELPPLPDLEIDALTKQLTSQESINQALNLIYERRPDLFSQMGERDKNQSGKANDEFTRDFYAFLNSDVRKVVDLSDNRIATQIFWKARRRARLMANLET